MSDAEPTRRGPGRPRNDARSDDRAAEVQATRRRRRDSTLDSGVSMRLALPPEYADDKAHDYRWVNQRDNRVQRLVAQDWDVVQTAKSQSSDDDRTVRVVGENASGQAQQAVLMRKPKEFVAEDEAAKMDKLRDQERAIIRAAAPEAKTDSTTYSPGANSISTGYTP